MSGRAGPSGGCLITLARSLNTRLGNSFSRISSQTCSCGSNVRLAVFCGFPPKTVMHEGKLVFEQLMLYLPLSTFRRCVAEHRGEHKVKDFSCLDQFFAMAFAQLTYRESLRDIEVNLRAQARRLYHMGFRCQTISRNTLANANATRPWQKQHLRIKVFFGTSENAVKTQIWIAISTYVLIAIAKKRLHLDHHSLYEILQILSLSMFETIPINQLLTPPSPDSEGLR